MDQRKQDQAGRLDDARPTDRDKGDLALTDTVKGPDNVELTSDPLADARLAAIVESSFDAIISKDLNSVIQTWNPAATRLFGYTAEEAVGRSITMLIPPNLHDEETEIISRIKRGERVESVETIRCRKDGSPVHISITVSPIRDRMGVIVGASKVARDISTSKESERRIRLLLREINHRVKNQFAVINSIIRETAKATADPKAFETTLRNRILALARSHDLLVSSEWSGASLAELIQHQLEPYGHEEQVKLSGEPVLLRPNAVQNLGMAFHELGTNSAKYGALSGENGQVSVSWTVERDDAGEEMFALSWDEAVPDLQTEPSQTTQRRGFGSVVLLRVAPQSLGGSATMERADGRVTWRLRTPLLSVLDTQDDNEHPVPPHA
ncbi:PAS domain S-box protein [Tianweitania sp. BSSL-BM11]|uniref:Blue-light-activated histidine kinase n=2 Tax=Tianweitania aestuarii TaxID=2814886 RepID=A0ABS5RRN0_9HYPH|nr:PAS domain S-box protein [Tianweitania aestuarii]